MDKWGDHFGCSNFGYIQLDSCSSPSVLTEDDFTYGDTTYTVFDLHRVSSSLSNHLQLGLNGQSGAAAKAALGPLTLRIRFTNSGGTVTESLAIGDATAQTNAIRWSFDPAVWTDGQQIAVSLTGPETTAPEIASLPPTGGQPGDTAPSFGGATVAALTLQRGVAMEPVTLPRATGGNGALRYGLTSEPAGLAGLSFDPVSRRLTGTPGRAGSLTFTYRADDADANRADSDAAILTFEVRVILDRAREAVKKTLAAVGTRTLSSALGHIGARFADMVPSTALTLAGQPLNFAAPGIGADGAHGACSWGLRPARRGRRLQAGGAAASGRTSFCTRAPSRWR